MKLKIILLLAVLCLFFGSLMLIFPGFYGAISSEVKRQHKENVKPFVRVCGAALLLESALLALLHGLVRTGRLQLIVCRQPVIAVILLLAAFCPAGIIFLAKKKMR